jgi:hypothetical protein
MMELTEKILQPCCPRCGQGRHRRSKLDWLDLEVDVCLNCFYIWPLPVKPDPRQAHTADPREAKPL